MGKIGQNPKIWQLWRPIASQPYVVWYVATIHHTKKLTRPRKLPGPWTTTWSKQHLSAMHPVTCSLLLSEVPVWPKFDFRFWGQMAHKVKFFEKIFPDSATGHRTTFCDHIWWKSAVAKLPKKCVVYQTKKNSGSAGLVPAPILAKMGRSRPKFPERCHPLTCPGIVNLVWIGCVLLDLFRKEFDFSAQKVNTI